MSYLLIIYAGILLKYNKELLEKIKFMSSAYKIILQLYLIFRKSLI